MNETIPDYDDYLDAMHEGDDGRPNSSNGTRGKEMSDVELKVLLRKLWEAQKSEDAIIHEESIVAIFDELRADLARVTAERDLLKEAK